MRLSNGEVLLHWPLDIVCKGDKVKEGQLIGYSGATGNVYGAHLHWMIPIGLRW